MVSCIGANRQESRPSERQSVCKKLFKKESVSPPLYAVSFSFYQNIASKGQFVLLFSSPPGNIISHHQSNDPIENQQLVQFDPMNFPKSVRPPFVY